MARILTRKGKKKTTYTITVRVKGYESISRTFDTKGEARIWAAELPWGQTGGYADTTEAIERTLALAVRYALDPAHLASTIASNAILTQN